MCLRCDEQRPGSDDNAIARVVDERCGKQPAETAAKAWRYGDVNETSQGRWHAREISGQPPSVSGLGIDSTGSLSRTTSGMIGAQLESQILSGE